MQLVLSVGNKVLDRVVINSKRSKNQDYINAQKRLLLNKHKLSIVALRDEPSFYLEAASKINEKK